MIRIYPYSKAFILEIQINRWQIEQALKNETRPEKIKELNNYLAILDAKEEFYKTANIIIGE